jgi:hypothetical protein
MGFKKCNRVRIMISPPRRSQGSFLSIADFCYSLFQCLGCSWGRPSDVFLFYLLCRCDHRETPAGVISRASVPSFPCQFAAPMPNRHFPLTKFMRSPQSHSGPQRIPRRQRQRAHLQKTNPPKRRPTNPNPRAIGANPPISTKEPPTRCPIHAQQFVQRP